MPRCYLRLVPATIVGFFFHEAGRDRFLPGESSFCGYIFQICDLGSQITARARLRSARTLRFSRASREPARIAARELAAGGVRLCRWTPRFLRMLCKPLIPLEKTAAPA